MTFVMTIVIISVLSIEVGIDVSGWQCIYVLSAVILNATSGK